MQCYIAVNFKQNILKTSKGNKVLEFLNWWQQRLLFFQVFRNLVKDEWGPESIFLLCLKESESYFLTSEVVFYQYILYSVISLQSF